MKIVRYLKVLMVGIALIPAVSAWAQSPVLTLEDCRRMALEQNKRIKAAQAQVDAAQAAHKAAGRNALPTLDGSLMGVHVGNPLDKLLPQVLGSATVTATQPIYAGSKIKLGKEATSKIVEVYQGQKAMEEADVLLAVENTYWQVVQVKQKVILASTYQQMILSLKNELQNAVDAGLTYKNDLLRAEVNLNQAELNIIKANDGLVLAKLSLAQLVGQPGNTDFTVADTVAGSFNEPGVLSLNNIADKRPEIYVLRKTIEAESLQARIIRADMKPQVGLSASGLSSVGKKVNFSNGDNYFVSYYGILNVSVPIFDWGKNKKKVQEQNLKVQARQFQLEDSKEQIDLQVQQAWLQLNQSVKKISLSVSSLQQADENLRLANDRLKAGTITAKDVLEAQTIWQQAYTDNIDAKVEYKTNMANYKKAIGEIK